MAGFIRTCQRHARQSTCLLGLLDVRPKQKVCSLDAGLGLPQAEQGRPLLTLASFCHGCSTSLTWQQHSVLVHLLLSKDATVYKQRKEAIFRGLS